MKEYITVSGDTWDNVSKKVYGSEYGFSEIMDANPEYYGVLLFDGGIPLRIPEPKTVKKTQNYDAYDAAAWRELMQ